MSKPELVLGGRSLLDRTLDAVVEAREVVIVGGPRRESARWTLETPAGGGPVAAVAAGMSELSGDSGRARWTVVLGVDTPAVADALELLLTARGGDGAWCVDRDDREQPLLAVYLTAALAKAIPEQPAGASMRTLVSGLNMARVPAPGDTARDVDTWDDVNFWKERLE